MSKASWDTIDGQTQMEITRVSHGVGGSYARWQGEPPAHSVYMIHLLEEYHPDEWVTVQVYHRHGDIVELENKPKGPEGHPFKSDMSVFEMHIMDYVAVFQWIEEDIR